MANMGSAPNGGVFISYSHKDGRWRDDLLEHLKPYIRAHMLTAWSDQQIQAGSQWFDQIKVALSSAKVAVLLVTPSFLASDFIYNEELIPLLKDAERGGVKILWIPVRPSAYEISPLQKYQAAIDPAKPLALMKAERDIAWVRICKEIAAAVPTPRAFPIVSPTRLHHGAEHLVGREDDLAALDAAWQAVRTEKTPRAHIITIAAMGGQGKTSLVLEWMARMARERWRGAEYVFDWSFYSQGNCEEGIASADPFVDAALRFFGDIDPTQGSPWDKGARLAQLVAVRRSLLVLDGLEPLQCPPGPREGKIKDPGVGALLKGLALYNRGLCLVTTRQQVADLIPFHDDISPQWELEPLSSSAGVDLLRRLKVKGTKTEMEQLIERVKGHALTLNLLGSYLAMAHEGQIREHDHLRFAEVDREISGGHAFKVMAAYERWLALDRGGGERDLAVLRLLGLFNRPAEMDCLHALRAQPAIPGLTEPLVNLSIPQWRITLKRLEKCGLVSVTPGASEEPSGEPPAVDAHPLIREYFASRLRDGSPLAWKAGHQRLFSYLRTHSERHPRQLSAMLASLHAVAHGCAAEQYERSLGLFRLRVRQGEKNVAVWRLGAFIADLAALRCFFVDEEKPSPKLHISAQAYVLNETGADLRALGRFEEAKHMINAAVMAQEQVTRKKAAGESAGKANKRLANYLGNKASLHSAIGTLEEARQAAERAVAAADASSSDFQRVSTRAALGHALHKMKDIAKARDLFAEATKYNSKWTNRLRALQGARYCALLLDLGQYEEVLAITNQNLPWTEKMSWRREVALEHLNRGLAISYIAGPTSAKAAEDLDAAVAILRQTGYQQYVPQALIARSSLHRRCGLLGDEGATDDAWKDLREACEIVHRTGHLLAECDALCVKARLWFDAHDIDKGAGCSARLQKLIAQTGYELRSFDFSVLQTWMTILVDDLSRGETMLEQLCHETEAVGYRACDEDIELLRGLLPHNGDDLMTD